MNAVVDRALELGHDRIVLSHIEGNRQAARFYAAHGFTETHRESGGSGLPVSVWMERRLTTSTTHDGSPRGRTFMSGRPDAVQQDAARTLEEMKRVREIEEQILARAPENDIGPSLERITAVMGSPVTPTYLPDDPPHRDQRQDVDEPDDRLDPARERAVDRSLHVAAPARHP